MQGFNLRCWMEKSLEVLQYEGLAWDVRARNSSGSDIQILGPKYPMNKYGPFEKNYSIVLLTPEEECEFRHIRRSAA